MAGGDIATEEGSSTGGDGYIREERFQRKVLSKVLRHGKNSSEEGRPGGLRVHVAESGNTPRFHCLPAFCRHCAGSQEYNRDRVSTHTVLMVWWRRNKGIQ